MDRLRELLAVKVRREKELAASGTPAEEDNKECWLCAKKTRTRFRFRDGMRVCFSCFRITYLALALPYIDTPARRQSDIDFLRRISKLEQNPDIVGGSATGSTLSRGTGSSEIDALFSTVELTDPSQAHFVMDASFMRRHRSHASIAGSPMAGGKGAAATAAATAAVTEADVDKPWTCPECTFFNRPGLRECEACGFVNPGTVKCPVCGQRCPVAGIDETGTKCTNGKVHVVWRCSECDHVNTLDGDTCAHCHKPRYWACLQCTALHSNKCGQDGLRYCATCGSYNTPEDILRGQAKIEREHKKAELVAAQQREDSRGDYAPEFGVNDSLTLAEVERQRDIVANRERLQSRLSSLNVPRHEQKSDGNCLFAALAHQLFGNARLHTLVRSLVVAYMRANEEDYAILFESKPEWVGYVERMSQPGCWGDELCLNAAARCFCVNVHVITSDDKRWHMIFQQDQLGKSNSNLRTEVAALARKPQPAMQETPTQMSYTRRTGQNVAAQTSFPGSDGVCLFLAYQAPVHYDDITPSPVKSIVLSDLLQPELHAMLKSQGGSPPPASAPAQSRQQPLPPSTQPHATTPTLPATAVRTSTTSTATTLPTVGRSSDAGAHSTARTTSNSTAPGRPDSATISSTLVAPRTRGPGSNAGLSAESGTLPPPTSAKRGSH